MQSEYTTISKLILRASNKVNARPKLARTVATSFAMWTDMSNDYALMCGG
jgi:hypothetical protein